MAYLTTAVGNGSVYISTTTRTKNNNDKNNNNGPICNIPCGVDWGDSGFPGFIIGARRRGLSYHDTEKNIVPPVKHTQNRRTPNHARIPRRPYNK